MFQYSYNNNWDFHQMQFEMKLEGMNQATEDQFTDAAKVMNKIYIDRFKQKHKDLMKKPSFVGKFFLL